MKKMKWFLLALIAAAGLIVLTGCGGVGSTNSDLAGRWVSADAPGFVTTFNADGTGSHAISWGYGTTFNWGTRGSNINWDYPGHNIMATPFRLSNNNNHLHITTAEGFEFLYIRD